MKFLFFPRHVIHVSLPHCLALMCGDRRCLFLIWFLHCIPIHCINVSFVTISLYITKCPCRCGSGTSPFAYGPIKLLAIKIYFIYSIDLLYHIRSTIPYS
jgi:hypothetical protein